MNWFDRMKSGLKTRIKREVPEGIWTKCPRCKRPTYEIALRRSHWICPECSHHLPISAQQYVEALIDPDSFTELDANLTSTDPLKFRDTKRYSDRIKSARKDTGLNEAIHTGVGRIGGHPVALGIMDTRFVMGSLGPATGEKITRLIDRAIADRRTLILICKSELCPINRDLIGS